MAKISIIVPVYNEENSIASCIESILNQTFTDIELIIVYRESSDDTLNIIKNFNDKRIKLIIQNDSSGVGGARNLGIDNATGNYIGFVECATIEPNYYKKLYNRLINDNSDISVSKITLHEKDKSLLWSYSCKKEILDEFNEKLLLLKNGACFNKLFRASLIKNNNIKFVENLRWEDNPFLLKCLYFSNKVSLLSDCNYDYCASSETWSDSYKEVLTNSINPIARIMMDFAKDRKFSRKEMKILKYMIFKSFASSFITRNGVYKEFKEIIGFSPYISFRYWQILKKDFINKLKIRSRKWLKRF